MNHFVIRKLVHDSSDEFDALCPMQILAGTPCCGSLSPFCRRSPRFWCGASRKVTFKTDTVFFQHSIFKKNCKIQPTITWRLRWGSAPPSCARLRWILLLLLLFFIHGYAKINLKNTIQMNNAAVKYCGRRFTQLYGNAQLNAQYQVNTPIEDDTTATICGHGTLSNRVFRDLQTVIIGLFLGNCFIELRFLFLGFRLRVRSIFPVQNYRNRIEFNSKRFEFFVHFLGERGIPVGRFDATLLPHYILRESRPISDHTTSGYPKFRTLSTE